MTNKGFQFVTVMSDQRFISGGAKLMLSKLKKLKPKKIKVINSFYTSNCINFYEFYYTYVLKTTNSKSLTYVGYTNNLQKRISLHNNGKGAKFTKGRKWKLIYKEKFRSKKKAMSREYKIKKNRKLRNFIIRNYE